MITWILLSNLAHADNLAVLSGQRCDPGGQTCHPLTIELSSDGRLQTSDGITGTYSLSERRELGYTVGGVRGGIPESPDWCWAESSSPLNPSLGSISVCLTPELQTLQHYDEACDASPETWHTNPYPEEDGHWATGRLTPEEPGGMWVHTVTYAQLTATGPFGPPCAPVDHRVRLFVGPADQPPPDTPFLSAEFFSTDAPVSQDKQYTTLTLPNPLFLAADQSLWVSMEQLYMGDDHTCIVLCEAGGYVGGMSYWSNSATTPYAWTDLNTFGVTEFMVRANGLYAAP